MSWALNSQKTRFDSLPEDVQERIVKVLMTGRVPDTAGYDIDEETLMHWSANRSILAFWVRNKQMRKKNP
jgi:hypothetical protein